MEVRIGVIQTAREISLEMADDTDRDKLRAQIEAAVANADGMLWLTDRKGKTVGLASSKIAYFEMAAADDKRKMGFGT